jgi:hypothetical protein
MEKQHRAWCPCDECRAAWFEAIHDAGRRAGKGGGMSKHTPGPWHTSGRLGSGFDTKVQIHHKSEHIDGGYFATVHATNKTAEALAAMDANARLIAAAPDLLAAAERLLSAFESFDRITNPAILDDMKAGREAIAKARGAS